MVLREKSVKMSMIFDRVLSEQSIIGLVLNTEREKLRRKRFPTPWHVYFAISI